MMRVTAPVLVLTILVSAACGGNSDEAPSEASPPTRSATTPAPAEADPQQLGEAIGALYVEALTEVVDLIDARPPAADVETEVQALKESYVLRFVELGRQKETLNSTERSAVDTQVRAAVNGVPPALFTAFSDGLAYYQEAGETALAEVIADFNIITQYADFDLLRQQEPEEARRLGVD